MIGSGHERKLNVANIENSLQRFVAKYQRINEACIRYTTETLRSELSAH
jgi:hypothetical protein